MNWSKSPCGDRQHRHMGDTMGDKDRQRDRHQSGRGATCGPGKNKDWGWLLRMPRSSGVGAPVLGFVGGQGFLMIFFAIGRFGPLSSPFPFSPPSSQKVQSGQRRKRRRFSVCLAAPQSEPPSACPLARHWIIARFVRFVPDQLLSSGGKECTFTGAEGQTYGVGGRSAVLKTLLPRTELDLECGLHGTVSDSGNAALAEWEDKWEGRGVT